MSSSMPSPSRGDVSDSLCVSLIVSKTGCVECTRLVGDVGEKITRGERSTGDVFSVGLVGIDRGDGDSRPFHRLVSTEAGVGLSCICCDGDDGSVMSLRTDSCCWRRSISICVCVFFCVCVCKLFVMLCVDG
jgi:hypothetical protein